MKGEAMSEVGEYTSFSTFVEHLLREEWRRMTHDPAQRLQLERSLKAKEKKEYDEQDGRD